MLFRVDSEIQFNKVVSELKKLGYVWASDFPKEPTEDTKEESIENLAKDIAIAREFGLEHLVSTLECICMGAEFGGKN